jgi:hypothetical protein
MTKNSTPSITLTDEDKVTLATAAHGAVALVTAAGVKSAGKVATAGAFALAPRPAGSGTRSLRNRRA